MKLGPDGWLLDAPGVLRVPSPRTCPLTSGARAIVWHWTGGPALGPAYAPALAKEISVAPGPTDRAASWHFLVAKNGRVIQSVPTTRGSWHVGRPGHVGGPPVKLATGGWRVQTGEFVANVNSATVGIELENSGPLKMELDGFRCEGYPSHPIPTARGVQLGGVWYDAFPDAQVQAARALVEALVEHHRLDREACSAGHTMYDPTRRQDPGPLWLEKVLPTILDAVFPPAPRAA